MTKASDLFIECLEAEGCEYVFGIPGEENLDFLDSLSRSKKIKLILTRHEQGAGFMASVYGRLTGKTGVCVATLGPGATNFTTAAAYAQLGGMPMMMITGQKPVKKSKQGRFQILDVVEMMKPITKYAVSLVASKMLTAFIDKTGIPFVTTQLGKGVVDERHPLFMGCAALSSGDFVHRAIEASDLILNIGHDVIEKPPFFMKAGGTEVIHISYNTAEVDPVYFPQIEVIGDVGNAVWQMKNDVKTSAEADWEFSRMMTVRKHHDANVLEGSDDARFPCYPQHVVKLVREAMPDDGIICLDNGVYKIWFARNYRAHQPNTVLLDNALATMGAGLPSAMAGHMVHPDRKVLAICGDGGFMMNSQELETAVREKMNLAVLILNDNSYGMIRWKQANMGFDDWGLQYGNPDFVKYVEAYGGIGHRVESAEALPGILKTALSTPGVHLIDCPVDYVDNDQILNVDIKTRSASI